jgi:hypothetical protein
VRFEQLWYPVRRGFAPKVPGFRLGNLRKAMAGQFDYSRPSNMPIHDGVLPYVDSYLGNHFLPVKFSVKD